MKKHLVLLLAVAMVCAFGLGVMAKTKVVVWSWSQEQADFYKEMKAKFEAQNPEIEVVFNTIVQDKYTNSLSLAFRGGDAPDVFFHKNLRVADLYDMGFIRPIDSFLTEEFTAKIPQEYFYAGAGKFGESIYALPAGAYQTPRPGYLYYNRDVLAKAGFDPDQVPTTWSELREMSKVITEKGNGKYFGMGVVAKPARDLERSLVGLASTVGVSGTFFDYSKGQFTYDSEAWVDLYTLARDMKNDGSFFPGFSSLDKTILRTMFAQGAVAFYFDGIWMPSVFETMGYPDLNYGVALPPAPDAGRRGYHYLVPSDSPMWYMSKDTQNPEAAWKVMEFMLSEEFQTVFVKNGFGYSALKTIDNASLVNDPKLQKILSFTRNNSRLWIMPEMRNAAAAKITGFNDARNVHPNIWEIMTSCLINDKTPEEFAAEAKAYNEKVNELFASSIREGAKNGLEIKVVDFIFPDWDPMEDYIVE